MAASNLRFATAHFLYASLLTASSVSLFGAAGLAVAAGVLFLWWQILTSARREIDSQFEESLETTSNSFRTVSDRSGFTRVELACALLISGTLLCLMLPARSDYDALQQASNSMQQIAKAIESYESKHDCRLPLAVLDPTGRPMHSWRALILNELGETKLAQAYRFDQPWNSHDNLELAKYRPWHYRPFYSLQESDDETLESRKTTFVHLHQTSGRQSAVIEHETCGGNWLAPDTAIPPEAFCVPPSLDEGFWSHGILWSEHRGRLLATSEGVKRIHGQPDTLNQRVTNRHPYVIYHTDVVIHALVFVLVALYPLKWLRRIRGQA